MPLALPSADLTQLAGKGTEDGHDTRLTGGLALPCRCLRRTMSCSWYVQVLAVHAALLYPACFPGQDQHGQLS